MGTGRGYHTEPIMKIFKTWQKFWRQLGGLICRRFGNDFIYIFL
jgi:hypothetical protein